MHTFYNFPVYIPITIMLLVYFINLKKCFTNIISIKLCELIVDIGFQCVSCFTKTLKTK